MWRLKNWLCGSHYTLSAQLRRWCPFTHPPVPHPHPGKTEEWGPRLPCRSSSSCSHCRLGSAWRVVRDRGRRNQNLGSVSREVFQEELPLPAPQHQIYSNSEECWGEGACLGLPGFGRHHPIRGILAIITA